MRRPSLGLALTEACLGGRGEFFSIDLTPNGSVTMYGCCNVCTREICGLGDSVRDTGDGLIDRSQVFTSVLAVVGVYVACVEIGPRPLVNDP